MNTIDTVITKPATVPDKPFRQQVGLGRAAAPENTQRLASNV